jgi:5-methylthioadenosine/S-adenosylhomocysteine deaminase
MTLFRGLADDLPLMTWLSEHIFPAEARLVDAEMVYWCSKLAAAEMILAGTSTVADAYFHEDAAAQAFCEAGMRTVAAQGIIDFPAPGVPDPKQNIAAAADFLAAWQGKNPLLTPALFCHSPYTCSPDTLQRAKTLAREVGSLFFIHLAETRGEVAQIKEQHGCTPVALLHNLGLLDEKTVCVHSVWLEEGDIDLLRESGAKVVTCPESNMKLASGIAPLAELIKAGIPVGLGTDGCASNNDLDLFQEMGCCARLHKVAALEPTRMPAAELLGMATGGGAGVLGMAGQTGRLAIGMRADCIIIDRNQPRLTPFHNPATLVYAGRGSDVSTVIIDGRMVMEERRLLSFDLEEALGEVRRLAGGVRAMGMKG